MPWPKGVPQRPEMLAKRIATQAITGGKRVRPVIVDGSNHWPCPTCGQVLPADRFYAKKQTPNGLSSQCRKCHSAGSIRTRDRQTYNKSKRRHEANRRAWAAGSGGTVTESDYAILREILGAACLRCGSADSVQWDHIAPLSRGGPHHPTNLQPLCRSCNELKHTSADDHRTNDQLERLAKVWVVAFKRVEQTT